MTASDISGINEMLARWRGRIETALDAVLPAIDIYPARLHQAMRYGTEGGKRLRALLVYAAGEVVEANPADLDAPACAVELIHAYSLIHDDLPAMDNDSMRRGRPTVHVAYGEPMAILTGDALLTLAFSVLTKSGVASAEQLTEMFRILADAAGSRGMVGGQAVDIESEGRAISLPELEALHIHKTGALFLACLRLAACAKPGLPTDRREALDRFGKAVGLAFQIQDDVLDEEGSTQQLGKTKGKDRAQEKSTYVSLMGLEPARQRADELFEEARQVLTVFDQDGAALRVLIDHIQARRY